MSATILDFARGQQTLRPAGHYTAARWRLNKLKKAQDLGQAVEPWTPPPLQYA